jgi:hypothetical protein
LHLPAGSWRYRSWLFVKAPKTALTGTYEGQVISLVLASFLCLRVSLILLMAGNSSGTVCVVNVAHGDKYKELASKLESNKKQLCDHCGYRCMLFSEPLQAHRPAAWDKIVALQKAFSTGCNISLWLDADTIVRRSFDALSLMHHRNMDVLAMKDVNGLNTGVMFLRRSAAVDELLQRAWQADQFTYSMWWEQRAIRYVLDTDPSLSRRTQLFTKLVDYPSKVDTEAPIFHAAGCFSSKAFRQSYCRMILSRVLDGAFKSNSSHRCPQLNFSVGAVSLLPRDISWKL